MRMVQVARRSSMVCVPPRDLDIRTVLRAGSAAPAPRAIFLNLFSVTVQRATTWERHRHVDHEAIVVERGSYRCRLNAEELTLSTGQTLVAKPGDWHEDLLSQGVRYHALVFRLEGGPLFVPGVKPTDQIANGIWRNWQGLLEALRRVGTDDAAPFLQDAALTPMVWLMVRGLASAALSAPYAPGDGDARAIYLAFERHIGRKVSIAALARSLGQSERSLDRRCRIALGLSPAKALVRHRLQRAAHLLRHSPWPVKRIAAELGFANAFHFTRAFARQHGVPPTVFRRTGGIG